MPLVDSDEHFMQIALPRHDYYARVLGYLAVAATLLVGYYHQAWGTHLTFILAFCLIYPSCAHLLVILITKYVPSHLLRTALVHIDALLVGLVIVYMDFALVPSLMFLIMIHSSFVLIGGFKSWFFCVTSLFIGTLFGIWLMQYEFLRAIPDQVTITAALGVAVQLSTAAYQAYRHAQEFAELKERFRLEEENTRKLSLQVSKYISPQIWENIFAGKQQVKLETQRKALVVFFSDIAGFTQLSDELEPEQLNLILNEYLTEMSKIVLKYGGTIDKYIGDSIMVFFGDPTTRGTKKDAVACVSMAIAMRQHMRILRQRWLELGFAGNLGIRMGINTGFCNVGNFGTESRMDYTIVGREVNLASRLESLAETGEILIPATTYELIEDKILCREKGKLKVRGFAQPITVFEVIDFRSTLAENSNFVQHNKPPLKLPAGFEEAVLFETKNEQVKP